MHAGGRCADFAARFAAVRKRLPAIACGVGAAGAAACLGWLVLDGAAAMDEASAAAARGGAALRIADLERDLSGLAAALGGSDADAVAPRFADLRAALAEALAAELPAGRLAPLDIEFLARFARDLDVAVAGVAAAPEDARAALRAAAEAHAGELAALRMQLGEAETAARAALADAQGRAASGLPLIAAAALALAALGAAAAMLARRPTAPNPAASGDLAAVRAELAAEIAAARLAKARFVMMMSHELRTPMNGMLGLLSLMKEYDPPEALRPLIDKAERAGRQLVAMLGDLLEVELEPEGPAAAEPLSVDSLAQSLEDMFGPAAARNGTDFKVRVEGDPPPAASGDGVKFQRAVSQICSQVVEQAGVSDVELALSHTGEECVAELSFAHAAGPEAARKLVEPAPAPPTAEDDFGAPGLGPLLARGLLEQMGGRLEVATLDSGRVLVLAAVPSKPLADGEAAPEIARPRVRILAQTRSLGALGAAAAAAGGVDVLAAEDAPAPDVVLVEAGGEEEARALAEARSAWPAAIVLALGEPDAPDAFDGSLPAPLDPAEIARAVNAAWARAMAEGAGAAPLVSRNG